MELQLLYVGARVYHSDKVSESFGTITEVTESDFSIDWDDGQRDTYPLDFAQFLVKG